MRHIFLSATLLLFFFSTRAQINYEGSYNTRGMPVAHLQAGDKYVVEEPSVITLYNLDNSIYKQINIPPQPGIDYYNLTYVSDGLFNTDTSDIEYLLIGNKSLIGGNYHHYVKIYSESGIVLFFKDSVDLIISFSVSNPGTTTPLAPIFNTDHGTKLNLTPDGQPLSYTSLIYSLPGTLPCSACGNASGGLSGMVNTPADQGFFTVNPNPGNSFSKINYELPANAQKGTIVMYDVMGRELKRYVVDKTANTLTLPISELMQGTYFYTLEVPGHQTTARQMIVIH